jgi:hypothetical protein
MFKTFVSLLSGHFSYNECHFLDYDTVKSDGYQCDSYESPVPRHGVAGQNTSTLNYIAKRPQSLWRPDRYIPMNYSP